MINKLIVVRISFFFPSSQRLMDSAFKFWYFLPSLFLFYDLSIF